MSSAGSALSAATAAATTRSGRAAGIRWATFDGEGCNFSVFSEVAHRVELCLFDDDGHERRVDLPETPHLLLARLRARRVSRDSATAFACTDRGIRRAAIAAIRTSCCSIRTPRRSKGGSTWAARGLSVPDRRRRHAPTRIDRSDARQRAASCRARSSSTPRSTGVTTGAPAARCTRPRSTSCTSRASPRACPACPPALRGTYAGLAHPAAIDYLTRLGVSAVELMPVHQFVHDGHLLGRGLRNYWGYNSIGFFAPHNEYASAGQRGEQVARVQGDGQGAARGRHRGDSRRRLQPHGRRQPSRADAVVQGLDNSAYYRHRGRRRRATTWTTPAPATA